jgi:hypothetical protein
MSRILYFSRELRDLDDHPPHVTIGHSSNQTCPWFVEIGPDLQLDLAESIASSLAFVARRAVIGLNRESPVPAVLFRHEDLAIGL